MNEPECFSKKVIDEGINRLIENVPDNLLTFNSLIGMMKGEKELKGHLAFYKSVLEDLLADHTKVNYIEKEQFLILHKCLVETYNELS